MKKKKKRKARKLQQVSRYRETGRKDIHHYYWVKAWYSTNRLLELDYDFHHGYHKHFSHSCCVAIHRQCLKAQCVYEDICCYCRTLIDFGKRVPQKEWDE